MKIKDLNNNELLELRKDIVLGSLYISDYQNSFDIDENEVCSFFDSFIEYLQEEASVQEIDDICELDTSENLLNWFNIIDWEIVEG